MHLFFLLIIKLTLLFLFFSDLHEASRLDAQWQAKGVLRHFNPALCHRCTSQRCRCVSEGEARPSCTSGPGEELWTRGPEKEETSGCGISQPPATGVAKPVPRPPTQQAPCTAEIKTIGAFPPLMRAVSWDTVGSMNTRNASPKEEDNLSDKSRESLFKSSGYKDFPVPPGSVQKLSKFREVILCCLWPTW